MLPYRSGCRQNLSEGCRVTSTHRGGIIALQNLIDVGCGKRFAFLAGFGRTKACVKHFPGRTRLIKSTVAVLQFAFFLSREPISSTLMQFGFPRDRQLRYADFARLRPAQKRGRAFMYLKLATLYTKYCRTYRPKFLRTVAMVAAVLGAGAVMQSAHMMPDWIPVWFLGVVARNHSVVRAPDLHPNVLFFLRDAGATTASSIPADLLRDKGPLLMLIWVVVR